MKRIAFVLLFLCACGREEREPSTTMPANPPPMRTATATAAPGGGGYQKIGAVPPAPPHANRSTPQKCAGDGSYVQAVDCFRMSAGFHFALDGVRGEMTRPTPGLERAQFKTGGVTWIGEAKHQGVVWSRNGTHDLSPPDVVNRVWQRTTMVLDPQKKEGSPQLAGTETISGESCNHYHFTNANSGEVNDVWVSTRDGRIVKWTAGKSVMELR
ncbi:MAG TPA: hypothetical protein VHY33_13065 [Thermoanaerobaculia bacterium]|nr:hypothetical protein [Thermoanaerobaculia bacterium]